MANRELQPLALSAFCENMAMLLSVGISPQEGVALLCDGEEDSDFYAAAKAVADIFAASGGTFSDACAQSGYFPAFAVQMLHTGEVTGRVEQVLNGLARFYENHARQVRQIRSAVVYPSILLLMMAAILGVLLSQVLPVFASVYSNMTGGILSLSSLYLRIAYTLGWAALAVTALLGVLMGIAFLLGRTPAGRSKLFRITEHLPGTRPIAEKVALARYMWVLDLYIASGMSPEDALHDAVEAAQSAKLRKAAAACAAQVEQGETLQNAVLHSGLLEPLYARMLATGIRSGSTEQVITRLSSLLSREASEETDRIAATVEPALSGILTLAVGLTLVAAMLPLIGMLGAIG